MVGENEQMRNTIKNLLIAIVLYVLFAVYGYFNLPAPYGIHSFWISAVVVAVLGLVFWLVKRLSKK